MSKSSPKSLKVTKAPKSCTHPTRGLMVDFKKTKIRDRVIENYFFVLRFKICTYGVAFKIRVSFYCFSKLTLFVKNLQIYFLRDQLLINFNNSNFKI